ncbi:MAG TPA: N-acetylglucosamine-6-phosphate deacetylase [Sulfurovum sp.]|jgi:N-acetylglucosamine-6-phosphate deacetylase|nr:MAG: N-acetylglucosamine-6-phosphate deacetylase [Sulfurovum sp. 35-42-20]OYZ25269.1 MAG: N-acetylglucosamine-6-phosphate deacetylase [Sulfurovum sp. 16-42-52]OYZ50058.1 MAG: N-acetylglucosamine-6-phosphate deacetylase [Sulfurovum sp. 24-42-9]OZA45301.1 MAG: N-acetylglucosamine-6-phosphate deacetylase [Sulfurovum sp. 17-42-90]OZA60577.1 MAG: N-acetylglucosamine-6-phosphate deacetylase [Sulfurovum sp. 39-42-12]HQR72951.1 N-acetylglucosamine-6-phosphate deacetylase [Sulfurovum sp.]
MKAIVNAKILHEETILEGCTLFFDTQIVKITDDVTAQNCEVIDAKGAYVSSGFIDLHVHGSGGADVMDASPAALETISATLLQTGVTSFLATTMTMSNEAIDKALQNMQDHAKSVTGANILGVHLEGPFINVSRHGAQNKDYVQAPTMALIEPYMQEIKMITLAPEVEGAEAFVKHMMSSYPHVVFSVGHSDASYEECKEGFRWGMSHATHLFNAMTPYHHRSPGIVGAVFDSDVSCDVIADLVHTHPSVLELVYRMKKEKLILITDAMRAGCMKCGSYDLGGQHVEVQDGKAVLEDGTLAGSVLKMNEALSNMRQYTSMGLLEVVNAATKAPAQKLGIKKGELKVGYDADIVIFDENFSIITTIVMGEIKYAR